METMRLAWTSRTTREQRLLLIMFALVAVVIIWLGILRPLSDAMSDARTRLDRATVEAGQIKARADALREARRSAPAALSASLAVVVGQAATEAGFDLARLDPQGSDRVSIAIGTARSLALFDWLGRLARAGIFVERITVRTNADATLGVDATLRARAS